MERARNPYATLEADLATRFIGRRIIYYPRLPSTMDAARREARRGAAEGTVILAGEQTRGRGRRQRAWVSPPGNIALSIILRPEAAGLPYLIMIASLAAAHAIEAATGRKTGIKWPNDILIEGKKVCGILIENELKGAKVALAVVGIGINIALRPAEFAAIADTAAGLEEVASREVPPRELLRHLFTEFERLYLLLPEGKPIYEAWRDRLVTLGRMVTVTWGENVLEGLAESVDGNGALVLRRPDGFLTRVVAGDVTLRDSRAG